jgi:hypothetical protein
VTAVPKRPGAAPNTPRFASQAVCQTKARPNALQARCAPRTIL